MMTQYEALKERALNIKSIEKNSKTTLLETKAKIDEISVQYKDMRQNKAIQEASIKVFRQVIDNMSQQHINSIIDLVSYALQTIFYDREYSLIIEIKDTRNNKSAKLFLKDSTDPDNVILSDIEDSVGGGVMSVIGFTLQVFYILYFNLNRVMFMDESLSAVSSNYLPNLMEFINSLAEKKDFKFIMIAHDLRFFEYAKNIYSMNKGKLDKINI